MSPLRRFAVRSPGFRSPAVMALALAGALLLPRPFAAQQPGLTQVYFAGRLVDNVPPDAQRVAPATMVRQILSKPLPLYPPASQDHWPALVQTLVLIDEKGVVASVLATDGPGDLAAAASSAVTMWRFHPYGKGPVVTTLSMLFLPPAGGKPGRVVDVPVTARLSAGVLAGQNTHKVIPSGVRGAVVFRVLIDPHGAVAAANLISGPPQDRDVWEQALADWRYRPYILNGEPVWVESVVSVNF